MTILDLRLILVLCCSLQLGRLAINPYPPLCPPEFPHQFDMLACRSVNEEFLTFQEAQASCVAKGGKLFEPRTDAEEWYMFRILQPDNQYHGYWVGVTDSDNDGVWTYLSDNNPLTASHLHYVLQDFPPPEGHNCMMIKLIPYESHFATAPCEEKARSVCQIAIHQKVCGIREGGELIAFNATYKSQFVTVPCDYTMASIVCGDYDVRVHGTSGRVAGAIFSPISARVVVQRALTQQTLVSAQISRKAIAKSIDGKNLWTVTDGAWSTEVSETFEPARQAAVIKIGDVGQVDFSASKDGVENGLYVRCKDVRSSAEFPETVCEFMEGTTNWSRLLTTMTWDGHALIFMWAIFLQNAGEQLQCSNFGSKLRSCPDAKAAVITCSTIFTYKRLTKCYGDNKLWFGRCLDAHCDKNVDRCKELKTKFADCGITFLGKTPWEMFNFMALLDSC